MEINEFSFKELYDFKIKSTYSMEVNGITIEPGEVIADFDKIQIANFQELKSHIVARGGYLNEVQISWDQTREMNIEFAQGIFSKTQFALMNNLKLIQPPETHIELIGEREYLESDQYGRIELKYQPHCDVYIYRVEDGLKIPREEDVTSGIKWVWEGSLDDDTLEAAQYDTSNYLKTIQIYDSDNTPMKFTNFIVDYCFSYENQTSILRVGREFTTGFLWAEGKTKVKDDKTGNVKTGIIRIPKLKLMSNLSIRVGKSANPQVGRFAATAYPTGSHGDKEVMRMIFLEDDIDSDL